MTMTLSGSGTIAGLVAGGLPDATITSADLASNAVDSQTLTLLNATGTAPVYACRAWVNFNGTGTVAINGSGNVSSITDNGTGNYTINISTAMPDTNYCWKGQARFNTTSEANGILSTRSNDSKTTTALQVRSFDCAIASTANPIDSSEINVAIFR